MIAALDTGIIEPVTDPQLVADEPAERIQLEYIAETVKLNCASRAATPSLRTRRSTQLVESEPVRVELTGVSTEPSNIEPATNPQLVDAEPATPVKFTPPMPEHIEGPNEIIEPMPPHTDTE